MQKARHYSFELADDLLMFARGDVTFVGLLHEKFQIFTVASGLQANLAKSAIYYGGVHVEERVKIDATLGYSHGSLPFKYLGIPLYTRKLSILLWQPLIAVIVGRITSWTTEKLSYGGRIQLVQSVVLGSCILGTTVHHTNQSYEGYPSSV